MHPQGAGELHDGVDPSQADARLQRADLRAMERCSVRELLLGEPCLVPVAGEVGAEDVGNLVAGPGHQALPFDPSIWPSSPYSASCCSTALAYSFSRSLASARSRRTSITSRSGTSEPLSSASSNFA